MPEKAYSVLHGEYAMPLPIPKPVPSSGPKVDLKYMTLHEAVKERFTDEHQPSKQKKPCDRVVIEGNVATLSRVTGARSLGDDAGTISTDAVKAQNLRGIVRCTECEKPRCLYSLRGPQLMKPAADGDEEEPSAEAIKACREYANEQLDIAKENPLFICGMQPLDSDNKLYGVIIVTRPHVECHDPVEFDYYKKTTAAWCDSNLCAYCAGGSGNDGTVDESLLVEWKTVLPLCKFCRDQGALPLARYRRRNGAARAKKASKARGISRQEKQELSAFHL